MHRRDFVLGLLAVPAVGPAWASPATDRAARLVSAARAQIGVTTSYDPSYSSIPYPDGDVPRSTGVCADVVVRAYRDALGADLQKLVHEDMSADFAAYPRLGARRPDANVDHRRVLDLETFFRRKGGCVWAPKETMVAGDAFPASLQPGDLLTWWLSGGRFTHIAVVASGGSRATVVHNIGRGAEELPLAVFHAERAKGQYRWLPA